MYLPCSVCRRRSPLLGLCFCTRAGPFAVYLNLRRTPLRLALMPFGARLTAFHAGVSVSNDSLAPFWVFAIGVATQHCCCNSNTLVLWLNRWGPRRDLHSNEEDYTRTEPQHTWSAAGSVPLRRFSPRPQGQFL